MFVKYFGQLSDRITSFFDDMLPLDNIKVIKLKNSISPWQPTERRERPVGKVQQHSPDEAQFTSQNCGTYLQISNWIVKPQQTLLPTSNNLYSALNLWTLCDRCLILITPTQQKEARWPDHARALHGRGHAALCSWARYFCLIVPLSTQMY